jgi:thymidine kinase
MKRCWKCAEEIQDAAVACRFCGTNQASLDRRNYANASAPQENPQIIVQGGPSKNSFQSCMGCVGYAILGLIALGFIGRFL